MLSRGQEEEEEKREMEKDVREMEKNKEMEWKRC